MKRKIIFIVGPTAVGKTAVGILLAKELEGEIVSCDSMQVYQDVYIASNKPSQEELREIPHHLIDQVLLTENFDVAQFEQKARACINDIISYDKVPIIVGGTGMYMKVLVDGIFDVGNVSEEIHQKVLNEINDKGCQQMHEKLAEIDPISAEKIHPNDKRRLVRALEVFYATGKPISILQQQASGLADEHDIAIFGLTMDRQRLYDRIDQRVDQMFDQGLIDEITKLDDIALSKTASVIIGIKEVDSFLNGQISLEEAKDEMKKNTRHLAKRQLTWFRADKRIQWINMDGIDDNRVTKKIISLLKGGV